jgi:alpha-D-ribose 1-methylphosphonate 5-phosphate C-P lyase
MFICSDTDYCGQRRENLTAVPANVAEAKSA